MDNPHLFFPVIIFLIGSVEYLVFKKLISNAKQDYTVLEHKRKFLKRKIELLTVGLFQALIFILVISPLLFFALHPKIQSLNL